MQRRLIFITLVTCCLGIAATMLGMSVVGFRRSRTDFAWGLAAQSAIARANLGTALVFDDQYVARETLAALGKAPGVTSAGLFRADGALYASYRRDGEAVDPPEEPPARAGVEWLADGRLRMTDPLVLAEDRVGMLVVEARHPLFGEYVQSHAGVMGALCGGVLIIVLGLSAPLHRGMVRPLDVLADTLSLVRQRQDFTLRMEPGPTRETAAVADAFNQLLDQLCRREFELQSARDRLEIEVQRRTCEHARTNQELKEAVAELKLAKESAESASRSKSQFLARMSHEIRTPMNGVLGMTDLLLQSGLTERQQNLAETVYRSGEALLHIINDILDFSKIEAGKLELDAVEFSIGELLEQTLELLAEHAQKKGLELIGWLDDAVPVRMEGDPNRLRQVLINLIGNAIKFTRTGDVSVQIQNLHEANNKVVLKFVVTDSGLGIAPDVRDRIFDPFSQADGSTTRKYGGTGLGLAICRQLTLMMGGEIGVDSEPGVGSTFWFTACFVRPVHAVGEHVASREALRGVEALLLADHRLLREVLTHRMVSWGMQVRAVKSVDELTAAVRSRASVGRPYRLAVMDEGASGTNAAMALRMVRSDPGLRDLPAVLLHPLTGTSEQDAKAAGFAGVVRKPVREAELYRTLAAGIGRKVAHEVPETMQLRLARQGLGVQFDAHILVAEDNLVNQEVIRGMLNNFGCRVTLVNNGREAVEFVKDGHYDLIFMDCQMPEMDGFDATRAIKRLLHPANPLLPGEAAEPLPGLPIVALTANAMEGDREMCLARGMDDYLSKPFRPDQLETMLLRWIPEKQAYAGREDTSSGDRWEDDDSSPMPVQWESTLSMPFPGRSPLDDERVATSGLPPVPPAAGRSASAAAEVDPDAEHPLDRKTLNSIRGVQASGVPNLLRRVIESYLTETPKLIDQLAAAVEGRDPSRIRNVAHALKSSSANVGARALADSSREIEQLTDAALTDFGEAFLGHVRNNFDTIRQALNAELEEAAL